ncbi:YjjG family noncanonical pyrimidine nucleotidase [Eubacterium sp. 1001713B170207_170306_E7]|uniref:YjjG family noncanonical pyrimidine nucleotidase n=1 Tax=Eubacterium sp. 1001713B170207_170306_E7 TaxID=2787097 RepID=UPI001897C319|nr:YjjG family noncanonical pyrimidine nucleotidase [Eubacterium sp. 1001713B170207_170306_E7]
MKKYTTLLFDADGTLMDFKKTEAQALDQTFRKYGVHPTREILDLYADINHGLWKDFEHGLIDKDTLVTSRFRLLFLELGLDIDGDAFEADYQPALGRGAFLIDGAYDLCRALKPDFRLYIITNGVSSTQYSRLSATGLDKLMDGVFVSEDAGAQKPQKEFFEYMAARIPSYNPAESLVIGDSLTSDIQGGINAGIDTCWYNPGREKNSLGIHADYEIHTLGALPSLLKS